MPEDIPNDEVDVTDDELALEERADKIDCWVDRVSVKVFKSELKFCDTCESVRLWSKVWRECGWDRFNWTSEGDMSEWGNSEVWACSDKEFSEVEEDEGLRESFSKTVCTGEEEWIVELKEGDEEEECELVTDWSKVESVLENNDSEIETEGLLERREKKVERDDCDEYPVMFDCIEGEREERDAKVEREEWTVRYVNGCGLTLVAKVDNVKDEGGDEKEGEGEGSSADEVVVLTGEIGVFVDDDDKNVLNNVAELFVTEDSAELLVVIFGNPLEISLSNVSVPTGAIVKDDGLLYLLFVSWLICTSEEMLELAEDRG